MKHSIILTFFALLFSLLSLPAVASHGCGEIAHGLPSVRSGVAQFIYDTGYLNSGVRAQASPVSVQYGFGDQIVVRLKKEIKARKVIFRALNMEDFPLYEDVVSSPPFMTTWTQHNEDAFLITGIQIEIYPVNGKKNFEKYEYKVNQRAVEEAYSSAFADWGFFFTPFCN